MEDLVFALVVAARVLVPLLIPRFPLPAILAALVIDAADQTVLAAVDAEPDNYQGYDKALDIYYLAIAYFSTIRNWPDAGAYRTAQFLWYYRLVGVVAFELSGARALLLIFPNTFEYFFILYEVIRLWWNPKRLTRQQILGSAAAIWILIKLPQEWWIHIAKLDVTDILADNSWLYGIALALAVVVGSIGWSQRDRIPAADWPPNFDVDATGTTVLDTPATRIDARFRLLDHPLLEKTVLVGLIVTIFAQMFEIDARPRQIMVTAGILVVANAGVSELLRRRGKEWAHVITEFFALLAINGVMFAVYWNLLSRSSGSLEMVPTITLLGLLTLIVTFYDRYRVLRLANTAETD